MTILDGHIHIGPGETGPARFLDQLAEAGVDGGLVISLPPPSFPHLCQPIAVTQRLDGLLTVTDAGKNLFPFFWIDPVEPDAQEQVDEAAARGVAGFKVICQNYEPGDARAMRTFQAIAERGMPILFHSGILWDGAASSRYSRPVLFESLIETEGLRFALAHVGWPWCDELLAVYGMFCNAKNLRPDLSAEMFIDLTPGTPPIYRKEILTKLFTIGYEVEDQVIFGTDGMVGNYSPEWARQWIGRDTAIYDALSLPDAVRSKVFAGNLLRLLGADAGSPGIRIG